MATTPQPTPDGREREDGHLWQTSRPVCRSHEFIVCDKFLSEGPYSDPNAPPIV
jgi:hypothetical protein